MAIKTVKLRAKSVVRASHLTPGKRVSGKQLVALENSISDRLNQNEARRAVGVEAAGQYMAK